MSSGLLLIFAIATGQSVSSNYLAQPLLDMIRGQFGITTSLAGLIITVAQVGYVIGLILLLPLGDLLDRRLLVTSMALVMVAGMILAAASPTIAPLLVAVGIVGVASVVAQILVPFAAGLALPSEKGRVVGGVTAGLLVGILVARTFSGAIAELAGWRTVYAVAASLMLIQALLLRAKLPQSRENVDLSYLQLLRSVFHFARVERVLRRRTLYGFLAFGSFSVLWTTLAFLLAGPDFDYGEFVIGLFGLAGAAGAATAVFVGRLIDQGWTRGITGFSASLLLFGFGLLWLGRTSVGVLLVGIVLLDAGWQGLHVTNQSCIFRLRPEQRSRLNAFYMTGSFLGAAFGSAASAVVYDKSGWAGVCVLGGLLSLAAVSVWIADTSALHAQRTMGTTVPEKDPPGGD